MTFAERREYELLKNETKDNSKMVEAEKYKFGLKLQNGLGNEIISELRQPPKKISKFGSFIIKLNKLLNN